MKRQVVTIGGGDSFSKHEDFLNYLKTVPLRDIYGTEKKRWRHAIAEELSAFEVFTLSMPNPDNAHYEEWVVWFERYFEYLRDDVVLVGSSLGGMFLAKYLSQNKLPVTVQCAFLLAAPCGYYEDETGNDCGSFAFDQTNLPKILVNVNQVQIWHSEDDFVVPYSHALEFKKYLPEAKLVTFTDRNHFLQEELPELVAAIKGVG
jgi:predicted alpha/beta hydrolase family esterase